MPRIPNLSQRNRQEEWMDDPALDPRMHRQALDGLARIHRFTGTAKRLWRVVQRQFLAPGVNSISILDVGCGDGYLLRQISRLAKRDGISVVGIGCDNSPTALNLARQAAEDAGLAHQFVQADVLSGLLPKTADVVLSSLFLHHFSSQDVISILENFDRAARLGVVVEDLRRTKSGYALCWVGTRLLSRSRVVHVDGLLSVAAAFTVDEIRQLAHQAGWNDVAVTHHWPERFILSHQCQRTPP